MIDSGGGFASELTAGVRRLREQIARMVDLTLLHTNHTVLVEGLEISICPVGTRRRVMGGSR